MSDQLGDTVRETLGEIQERDGPAAAYETAASNIAASICFLLEGLGPRAATRALANVSAALDREIETQNAGTRWLQ
jgi:hypothetical protein